MNDLRFNDAQAKHDNADALQRIVAQMRAHPWHPVPCVVCPADGSAAPTSPAYIHHGIEVQECPRCGHLYTSPRMPEAQVPELYGSVFWEQYMQVLRAPILEERVAFDYQNALSMLRRDVLPYRDSGRLLDVGASNGGMVRRAAEHGFQAVGLEPAPEVCALARRVNGVEMLCGSVPEAGLEPESFDVITMHDTLEHLFEPVRDLELLARALAPEGILVLETLSADSLNFAEQQGDWFLFHPLDHVHYFSEQNIQRVLERLGLELLDLYCPHEDNWICVARKPAPAGPR